MTPLGGLIFGVVLFLAYLNSPIFEIENLIFNHKNDGRAEAAKLLNYLLRLGVGLRRERSAERCGVVKIGNLDA